MKAFEEYKPINFDYPKEMYKIIVYLEGRGKLYISYKKLEQLYYEFSRNHCAGWLIPDDYWLSEFMEWLSGYELN